MTRESLRKCMWASGRFVKVLYSLTMLGNSGIEWGGIGDNGGFVESRNHHGAAGVTSRWAARLQGWLKCALFGLLGNGLFFGSVCRDALGVVLG